MTLEGSKLLPNCSPEAPHAVLGTTNARWLDLRPWNLGTLAGQRVKDILPILQQLELDPTLPAPGGESFFEFCDRYSGMLEELLEIADRSQGCIVAVTRVRNLLAAPTLLHRRDRTHIPVSGGPKTGSLVWVEKDGEGWNLRVDEAPDLVRTGLQSSQARAVYL